MVLVVFISKGMRWKDRVAFEEEDVYSLNCHKNLRITTAYTQILGIPTFNKKVQCRGKMRIHMEGKRSKGK